jgi:hypothetical protein
MPALSSKVDYQVPLKKTVGGSMIASISKQDSFSQIRELTELEMRKKKI